MVAPVAARAAANTDPMLLLAGAGALLLLAKWGLGNIPNPIAAAGRAATAAGRAVATTGYELSGGIRKDRDESWTEYLFEYDVPFSDKRIPWAPGLVRKRGAVYTTGGPLDPGGQMAAPWTAMDIVEPDESLREYFGTFDLPGLPAYDYVGGAVDLYKNTLGKVLR